MSDLECPYCEQGLKVNHDDGGGYAQDVSHQMECKHCGRSFIFQTEISFSYTPYPADCLNGIPHDYKLTHTFPKPFSKMRCSMCDDEREMSEEERIRFGIQTKDEYFKTL